MKALIIIGIIFFLGSIGLIIHNYDIYRVDRYGQVVKMRIESLPGSCIGSKSRYFVTYSYKNKIYDKQMQGRYCENHYVGEIVEMKMFKGSDDILFPNESALSNLIAVGLLGLIGLLISITQWKKLRNGK